MGILVIALSINPRPLSAPELKLSGLIGLMESRVETAGDNQNAHVIISNYHEFRIVPNFEGSAICMYGCSVPPLTYRRTSF